eukprot:SAG31_NODE_39868_length_285_cov_0.559140_1_plen_29_part_10
MHCLYCSMQGSLRWALAMGRTDDRMKAYM